MGLLGGELSGNIESARRDQVESVVLHSKTTYNPLEVLYNGLYKPMRDVFVPDWDGGNPYRDAGSRSAESAQE